MGGTKRPEDEGDPAILYLIRYMDSAALKIGQVNSSSMLERRTREFRTLDPNLEVIKTWTIRRNWESHVRHFATRGTKGLTIMQSPNSSHSEVFRFTAMIKDRDAVIQAVTDRIDGWVNLYTKHHPPARKGGS